MNTSPSFNPDSHSSEGGLEPCPSRRYINTSIASASSFREAERGVQVEKRADLELLLIEPEIAVRELLFTLLAARIKLLSCSYGELEREIN